MNISAEQREIGQKNFQAAQAQLKTDDFTMNRRDFMGAAAAGVLVPSAAIGGFYFGYDRINEPVRVAVIGTGDEGNVLLHNINPDYIQVKAICDIRPYNVWRAFNGQPGAEHVRQGMNAVYGWADEAEGKKHVKVYDDYKQMLRDEHKNIEGVIIALPLFLHAEAAVEATKYGLHVLTEKLMGWNIGQCKAMARAARKARDGKGVLLATGHQRHYSVLYEQAKQMIKLGLIGDIHHIRAQWHRGNLPGKDSWKPPMPTELISKLEEVQKKRDDMKAKYDSTGQAKYLTEYNKYKAVAEQLVMQIADKDINAAKYGYKDFTIEGTDIPITALEELIRWRLWNRTGGGLMAELGSHQLDAASIFVSAMREDGQKVKPKAVSAVGGRHLFPMDREVDDHVYCTFEFPGPENYRTLPKGVEPVEKEIVVTYSSINGNGFGDWGEVVMGTEGTLVMDRETDVMVFGNNRNSYLKISRGDDSKMAMATTDSGWGGGGGGNAGGGGSLPAASGPVSRGYKEEMEHWAWCIRHYNQDPEIAKPRCGPAVAMADAIIALTANIAMEKKARIEFKEEWFDIEKNETPEEALLGKREPMLDQV